MDYTTNQNNAEEFTKDFSAHEVPYTGNKVHLERWARFSIRKCYGKSKNASSNFFASDDSISKHTFLTFIEKMLLLYEGTYSSSDTDFLTKEGENSEMVLPARLINYPLLKNNFDIITGQFIQTQIDLSVASVSPDAIDKKLKIKANLMANKLIGSYVKSLEDSTGVQLENRMPIVDDEEKYLTLSYKEMEELNMTRLLKVNYYKHAWPEAFRKNILFQFLVGFFAYEIVEINGDEIKLRVVKPTNAIVDWDCEDDYGEDMMFIGEERFMTLSGIMQYIKPDDKKLQEIKARYKNTIENNSSTNDTTTAYNYGKSGIRVIKMNWLATKKQKVKIIENKYNPEKKIVKYLKPGEEGVIGKKEVGEIKTIDVPTWYTGYLVDDIVCNFQQCENMPISYHNPSIPSNDYIVGLYNRILKKPNGMMQNVSPLQELWNELMFKLELEIATSPGNVVEYDAKAKPKNLSYSQVFYYMKAKKLLITEKPGGVRSMDLGLSSTQHLLNLLMYVETLADTLTGTNKFKKAQVSGDTAVGTMKTAIAQADLLLEPPFQFHREALRRVFKKAAAKLKLLNQYPGEKQKHILGENGFQYYTIKPTLPTEDYDIYFVDGTIQARKKEMLMMLMDKAFNAGQATIEQLLVVIKHEDINEIYADLNVLIEQSKKQKQAYDQMQQQIETAKVQSPFELEKLKGEISGQIESMKKQFDAQIAQMYADAPIKKEMVVKQYDQENNQNPNK